MIARIMLLVFLLASFANPLMAQTDSVPVATPTTQDPELAKIETHHRAIHQITHDFTVEFEAQRDFARDYQVVYLISENAVTPDALISPENILAALPTVKVIHNWDNLLAFVAETPVHGLVIHGSALEWIDPAWTQNTYANNTPIITLDSTANGWALLSGHHCRYRIIDGDTSAPFFYRPHYDAAQGYKMIVGVWVMTLNDETRRAEAAEIDLRQCKTPQDRALEVKVYESMWDSHLANSQDFDQLIDAIRGMVVTVDLHQNQHLLNALHDAYFIENGLISPKDTQ